MRQAVPEITDRTNALEAIGFVRHKLSGYDLRLLDWIRISPMTAAQHVPEPGSSIPPLTLSTCWLPRETEPRCAPPRPEHMYRIKVNVWQGTDYPAEEMHWGRIPPIPIRRRTIPDRYTTTGMCRWSYPDRLAATVHALARPLFLYLASTRQVNSEACESNASAWGHRWLAEWLRSRGQGSEASVLLSQLMQWTLIQSKGW